MKGFLRTLALVLLMLVVLLTISRQQSPSMWIVFTSDRDSLPYGFMMREDGSAVIPVPPDPVCGSVRGWSPNSEWILFSKSCEADGDFFRIRPGHRTAEFVISGSPNIGSVQWSPDGEQLVVTRSELGGAIYVMQADGSNEHFLAAPYRNPHWSPDGEWIYAYHFYFGEYTLHRIHVRRGYIEDVLTDAVSSDLSWSPNGTQFVTTLHKDTGDELFIVSPDDSSLTAIVDDLPLVLVATPRWSPDGEWIVFQGGENERERFVYRIRIDGSDLERLTPEGGNVLDLQWSPDGEWILFTSDNNVYRSLSDVYRIRPDGSQLENLTPGPEWGFAPQYGQFPGADFNPLWLTLAAAGLMILSMMGRFFR